MKVVWDIKNEKAIPLAQVRVFEIEDHTELSDSSKERLGIQDYSVIARYQVCTGCWATVFTSDSKAACIHFIDTLEGN